MLLQALRRLVRRATLRPSGAAPSESAASARACGSAGCRAGEGGRVFACRVFVFPSFDFIVLKRQGKRRGGREKSVASACCKLEYSARDSGVDSRGAWLLPCETRGTRARKKRKGGERNVSTWPGFDVRSAGWFAHRNPMRLLVVPYHTQPGGSRTVLVRLGGVGVGVQGWGAFPVRRPPDVHPPTEARCPVHAL